MLTFAHGYFTITIKSLLIDPPTTKYCERLERGNFSQISPPLLQPPVKVWHR